jgi:sulfatase modifying factor 1
MLFVLTVAVGLDGANMPEGKEFTNSLGMKFVRIEPGTFEMGFEAKELPDELITDSTIYATGDFDEHPRHSVTITKPFYMAVFEVTNVQYEKFDPAHKQQRSRLGLSKEDDEAVIFVSWNDAMGFCKWLGEKDPGAPGPYRLATEAEWEYAARAGTATPFYTGVSLPKEITERTEPRLAVGKTPPNAWGLYDMHGNVEEWCYDWYGPYEIYPQTDPVGRVDGDFRVARGGSHSTMDYYLRSANRIGSPPDDRQWLSGFRIVVGELPKSEALKKITQPHQRYVKQNVPTDIAVGPDPDKPYFKGPNLFVKIPDDAKGPLFGGHSHFTAITECPNGDLLSAWFTCYSEKGRELSIAASRLRYGHKEWEPASSFWDAPDRNDHAHTLWHDGNGTIFHFNGLAVTGRGMAMLLRKSTDSGATWSKARFIWPDHDKRTNFVVESVFRAADGRIVVPSDGRGGSILSLSSDEGKTWTDPGGSIRGIHAGVVQLNDGRLMAFGRRKPIDGKIPISISGDMGKSWQYSPGPFQPVNLGQRVAFMRLKEGPLFFASFCKKTMIKDVTGNKRPISGLFAAVSEDEGKTWSNIRPVSDDGPGRDIETMDGHPVTLDASHSEYVGYLSVCQTPDNVVHLLSSRNHYSFNLKWLKTPPPAAPAIAPPVATLLERKKALAIKYVPGSVPSKDKFGFSYRGPKETEIATSHPSGGIKIKLPENQQCWWRSASAPGYDTLEQSKGFTAEIKTQIRKTGSKRGVDLELYDGAGSRYALTITENGIYWYEGIVLGSAFLEFDQYTPVAESMDNTDAMHTYRLAVRGDRCVQIYRDEKLIGSRRYEYRTPRGAYILFGAGHGTEAIVDSLAYDLSGPYAP